MASWLNLLKIDHPLQGSAQTLTATSALSTNSWRLNCCPLQQNHVILSSYSTDPLSKLPSVVNSAHCISA